MASNSFILESNIIDPVNRRIGFGKTVVANSRIESIEIGEVVREGLPYLLPGFIDAHIHIESSMLTPPAFARIAVKHGTVATVSDPHEIANVCGIEGVRYMVDLGRKSGFKFYFGAPSCVPATPFETSGASLPLSDIRELFESKDTHNLAEMMNYPAVLANDPLVMDKIQLAKEYNLNIDGHAPGLKGKDAARYAAAGITTDHECTTLEEALDKIDAGMHIIIREGSAAKNYDALHTLINSHPDKVMFCSDDKHPDDLLRGHINQLVTRSLDEGYDMLDILRITCVNPIVHYKLDVGQLQTGDPADMILVEDLTSWNIQSTWIAGQQVYDGAKVSLPTVSIPIINSFGIKNILIDDLSLSLNKGKVNIIRAINGAIITEHDREMMEEGLFESNIDRDILKIVVVNRYQDAVPAVALIRGFGMKDGAIASSVAHDSHNIVAVGTNDADLAACINEIIHHKGGVAATKNKEHRSMALPVAGLMSTLSAEEVGHAYESIDLYVKTKIGCELDAPFMTLSFMALLVIPSLKLSDLGLFDGKKFEFTSLQ
ncbi:MAG: adenine deaminase [Bacteroidota bacterium]|nr:adenine deaminase [Bacteroidota bacterium]